MQEFISFLQENWRFLVELILLVISLIIVLVKPSAKIKVPESVIALAMASLPVYIQQAEDSIGSGNGLSKKEFVLNKVLEFISSKTGFSVAALSKLNYILDDFDSSIELILSCPVRKKGEE